MKIPDLNWHSIIIADRILLLLDENFNIVKEKLTSWTEDTFKHSPDIESPEAIAIQIGTHAYMIHEENFRSIIQDDIDSYEGKELAKGYIGTKALENTDLGK